jgi:regulator of cell morphogenesis and NO signaling
MPVGQLVAEDPRRARLFERLGIDYCCKGQAPLDRACRDKGLDIAAVLRQLAAGTAEPPDGEHGPFDAATITMRELIDHIVTIHHAYLYRELPRLAALAGQVVGPHGIRHPELREVRDVFDALKDDLKSHMIEEETVVFPILARLEAEIEGFESHGGVEDPIRVMEHEHDDAGAALARLRALTGGYTPPADACPTYRALLAGLAELEADLHVHIHEENNILFPRARAAEGVLRAAAPESHGRYGQDPGRAARAGRLQHRAGGRHAAHPAGQGRRRDPGDRQPQRLGQR